MQPRGYLYILTAFVALGVFGGAQRSWSSGTSKALGRKDCLALLRRARTFESTGTDSSKQQPLFLSYARSWNDFLTRIYRNPPRTEEELKVVYATGESIRDRSKPPHLQFHLSVFYELGEPSLLQSTWASDLMEAFVDHTPQFSPLWVHILEQNPQFRSERPELDRSYDPWSVTSLWNTDPSASGLGVARAKSLRWFLERTAQFPILEYDDPVDPGSKRMSYKENPSEAFQIRAELARPLLMNIAERTQFLNALSQKDLTMIRDLLSIDCNLEPPSAIIEFYFFNHPIPNPGILNRLRQAFGASCKFQSAPARSRPHSP
jgi:hypothetical protein